MTNIIQIKRSVSNATIPGLQPGEPAHSEALPGQLHIGQSTSVNDVIHSYPPADKAKLATVEDNATADQTGAQMAVAIDAEPNLEILTTAERTKLAGLEEGKFKGRFTAVDFATALVDLTTANPTPPSGSIAEISDGATVKTAIWNGTAWVEDPAAVPGETAASVKTKYEANANTNEFNDAEKAKLGAIEDNATADQTGAEMIAAIDAEADANIMTDAERAAIANAKNAHVDQTDTPNAATMLASKNYLAIVNAAGTGIEYVAGIDGGSF